MRGLLLATSICLAVQMSFAPVTAKAQVVNAKTDVHGLTCPFCAFGAKKKLKTVEGVKKVSIDVDQGLAVLHAQSGESIQVQQIPSAIKKAGFKPGMIKITAIGHIQKQGNQLHLMLSGADKSLVLIPGEVVTQSSLEQWMEQADEVQILGVWSMPENAIHSMLTPTSVSKPSSKYLNE